MVILLTYLLCLRRFVSNSHQLATMGNAHSTGNWYDSPELPGVFHASGMDSHPTQKDKQTPLFQEFGCIDLDSTELLPPALDDQSKKWVALQKIASVKDTVEQHDTVEQDDTVDPDHRRHIESERSRIPRMSSEIYDECNGVKILEKSIDLIMNDPELLKRLNCRLNEMSCEFDQRTITKVVTTRKSLMTYMSNSGEFQDLVCAVMSVKSAELLNWIINIYDPDQNEIRNLNSNRVQELYRVACNQLNAEDALLYVLLIYKPFRNNQYHHYKPNATTLEFANSKKLESVAKWMIDLNPNLQSSCKK